MSGVARIDGMKIGGVIVAVVALFLQIGPARAADPEPDAAARFAAAEEARLHTDWANLGRFHEENQQLFSDHKRVDIVFMGDSITQGWPDKDPDFFKPGRVNRGISGQTTPQMLVRFRQDVIDLRPCVVHIWAATNDLAQNTGPMTLEQTEANFRSMTELAQKHGIKVVLASTPPAADFHWHPGLDPAPKIKELNAWLKRYAAKVGAVYADYYSALQDGNGGMNPDFTYDGVHLNEQGYAAIRRIAEAALCRALK